MKLPLNRDFDWTLLLLWFILITMGFIAIYSASTIKIDDEIIRSNYYLKQIIWISLSFVSLYIILKLPMPIIDLMVIPVYVLTNLMLIAVLFMPAINQSHRWISLMGFRFQPSELAKLIVILLTAKILAKESILNVKSVIKPLIYMIIPMSLIIIEPDLSTTIVFWVAYFIMLAQAGFKGLYLILILTPIISIVTSFYVPIFVIFALLLIYFLWKSKLSIHFISLVMIINIFFVFLTPVLWNKLKPYQQNRILTFIDPSKDPLNTGYQIIQAKIAIGSGQLTGKGFLEGTQKNLNFLPENHTDFIFSVISEEFGFAGSALLLTIFLLFFLKILNSIKKTEIKERQIAIAGFFGFLFFQTLTNLGMNIGLMPVTGISLPFISYGGSNLLINTIAVALILKFSQEKDL
jgi:rod shape determining protein RodA